jgi:uncharacterized protein (UPF0210 family)
MKVRSVTCFMDADPARPGEAAARAGVSLAAARSALTREGWEVQTTRLALPPCPTLPGIEPAGLAPLARRLEEEAAAHNIDFVTLGPVRLADPQAWSEAIPDVLAGTRSVFAAAEIATAAGGLSLGAVRRAARVIHRCAPLGGDGFANLRFAALANVTAGVPFLPAAYHGGGPPCFALATEAADLAVTAFLGADSLAAARARLLQLLESRARDLQRICTAVARDCAIAFSGIDLSLAPYPEQARSIGAALESLGLPALGLHGSAAAAAFLTDTLDRARFQRVGFSGLFLPVLEDDVLARRAGEGTLTLSELLLYSAVCGTGLDTVPLPGDLHAEQIAAVLLDVGALALRLGKPLTARLMPLPGKRAGDPIRFDFPYFAPGRVLDCKALPLTGLLAGSEAVPLGRYAR